MAWIPAQSIALGTGFLGGGCGLILLDGLSLTWVGLAAVGVGLFVWAVFEVRVLARSTTDVIEVRTITGTRRTSGVNATLHVSTYGAGHVKIEAVTASERGELIYWTSPLLLARMIGIAERIGRSLELPVHVDPEITESLSFQRRAWRIAGVASAIFFVVIAAVALALRAL